MTTFSVNLTNLTDTLPQSRDQSNCNVPTAQTHCSTRSLPTCDISLQACQCYLRLELETLWNYSCYKRNSAFYPYTLYVRAPYDSRNKDYFSPYKVMSVYILNNVTRRMQIERTAHSVYYVWLACICGKGAALCDAVRTLGENLKGSVRQ